MKYCYYFWEIHCRLRSKIIATFQNIEVFFVKTADYCTMSCFIWMKIPWFKTIRRYLWPTYSLYVEDKPIFIVICCDFYAIKFLLLLNCQLITRMIEEWVDYLLFAASKTTYQEAARVGCNEFHVCFTINNSTILASRNLPSRNKHSTNFY